MTDLLLPHTDAGVLAQLALTVVVGSPIVLLAHRRRATDVVWFVGGLMVLLFGLFAFRTVH